MRTLAFVVLAVVAAAIVAVFALLSGHAAATTAPPRTVAIQVSRSLVRPSLPQPWLTGLTLSPQGVIPAASPSAAPPSRPATAAEQTSPSASASAALPGRSVTPLPAPSATAGEQAGATSAQWAKLRQCESGDKYDQRANPRYRGAYQIGFAEWAEYGGTGRDPADASPVEQDAVALRLWVARGWQPWASSSACSGLS